MSAEAGPSDGTGQLGLPLVDPRCGDIENDFASPEQGSILAIAGRLLAEISLPKLLFSWVMSLLLPAVLLGLAPLIATAWFAKASAHILALTEFGAALVLVAIVALGWLGWRPLWRIAEDNFWSLNALVVQPGYVFGSELLRHLAEQTFARHWTDIKRARLRATSSANFLTSGARRLADGSHTARCSAPVLCILTRPTQRAARSRPRASWMDL